MPSLVMWGQLDQVTPISGAEFYTQHLPSGTTILYEDLGHVPMEEAPERTSAGCEKWLLNLTLTTQEAEVTP